MLRALDVCAGAGGWAVAARGLPLRIVAAFDHAEDCLATYATNHPDVECVACDVTEYDFRPWKEQGIDLVLGGIPCEPISKARNGTPLDEEKRAEFMQLVETCLAVPEIVGARWWCFEDVMDVLRYTPLFTPHFILDSASYSPQRRKRAYLGNLPRPQAGSDARVFADCMRPGPYRRSMRLTGREPGRTNVYNSNSFYPWEPDEKAPTVIALCSRHDNYAAAPAPFDGWRQLEWQELAALQGFPEDYVFCGSPTRVVKQVSQAVQVDTARAILQALCALNEAELGVRTGETTA